ncbi:breast carcinoma-amplified sequence 4 [Talpa occidentalis]|uniref:breast carcinoma-amplified sequence 4 n=1 Tax=Talpa occidentalis TaxID=50954 RepID=UPI00188FC28E|nr:breast carcinoma-amplified sequence 4 [Talpa occidentalis]
MRLLRAGRPGPASGGARELALLLTPEPGPEAKEVEENIEEMLLRLEEFCSLTDMIRSDTSQILEENIPLLKAKLTEMRGIYAQVDRLEAFVEMVRHHVSFLEAHVLQAERDHGAFSQALRRWLGSSALPSLRNKPSTPARPTFELPTLYRTEDYFPVDAGEARPERLPAKAPACELRAAAGGLESRTPWTRQLGLFHFFGLRMRPRGWSS